MNVQITVERMLEEKGELFELELVAGNEGLRRKITQSELHRPGLAFAGFLEVYTFDRIQILGNTEISYLASLEKSERSRRLQNIFEYSIPCFIVTAENTPPEELLALADKHSVPVFSTPHETSRFNAMISFWLEREFAPTTTIHAVFVDVFGEGVLITGDSGVGKSECGLELIERGHRLVADDVVVLRRLGRNILMGSSVSTIQHHMEVRGLGIIDVELLFGIGAVREEKRVSLAVDLHKMTSETEVDRLGLDKQRTKLLDVDIPYFRIPVDSGRNISILVEVASLHHRILERGINPAQRLNDMLIKKMTEANEG